MHKIFDTQLYYCGGTIISENYVLTVSSCVKVNHPEMMLVIAGVNFIANMTFAHEVEKVIAYPNDENHNPHRNNIALLKLKTPFEKVPTINSISLPTKDVSFKVGDIGIVAGWGFTKPHEIVSDQRLHYTTVLISDQDECRTANKYNGRIYETDFCAYNPDIPQGPCVGDGGDPLTINGKFVGFVSWSRDSCASTEYPTIYTRLSSYVDWIKENAV
ncbi:trypsin-5-like isoform X1 [Prorops nasuta]|uniref:trypsin-5-like isoform X1 n=1 Tax=Prorops nasuta TaxID=863751 RepID=UPI0034CDB8A8